MEGNRESNGHRLEFCVKTGQILHTAMFRSIGWRRTMVARRRHNFVATIRRIIRRTTLTNWRNQRVSRVHRLKLVNVTFEVKKRVVCNSAQNRLTYRFFSFCSWALTASKQRLIAFGSSGSRCSCNENGFLNPPKQSQKHPRIIWNLKSWYQI